jgi:hypothetical protein
MTPDIQTQIVSTLTQRGPLTGTELARILKHRGPLRMFVYGGPWGVVRGLSRELGDAIESLARTGALRFVDAPGRVVRIAVNQTGDLR